MKKISDILPYFIKELSSSYMSRREIISVAYLVIEHYLKFNRSDVIIYNDDDINKNYIDAFKNIVSELKHGKPIQYILSETLFLNLKIHINSNVLIPRPETEELVEWIIKDNQGSHKDYLDIGTGSGCIIISLAKRLQGKFTGIDISNDALQVARKNVTNHNVDVNLENIDIIENNLLSKWDVIVSNPPYVLESEKKLLDKNIFYEPEIALFVDNNDPLLYYKHIAEQSVKCLNNDGILYFEINQNFGHDICNMLSDEGFVNIELKKDINDKERMIKAILK